MVRLPAFYAYILSTLFAAAALLFYVGVLDARVSHYSDTISDSGPLEYSDHTVQFKTLDEIAAGGFVRFRFTPGEFYMPTTTMSERNVELYVSQNNGPYQLRNATTTPSMTEDGISITYGSDAAVEVTLNSTEPIPAGANVRLLIGKHTSGTATTTDTGVLNPDTQGSYPMYIETSNGDALRPWIAIVDKVNVGPVDTTETDPPFRFNGAPTGMLSGTTQNVELSLRTDEFARCRYSNTPDVDFAAMTNTITNNFNILHVKLIPVASNTPYTFYVRCIDDEGNANPDDYLIAFTVRPYPEGVPGEPGEEEGSGDGDGDNSEGTGSGDNGENGGTGGNPPGPGGGSSGSGGASSGSGSSGGGGGGSSSGSGSGGGGGLETTERPYQSGDGQVVINGYAFPGSTVTILVDGRVAGTARAGTSGAFTYTIDAIARGVYTFGVYATDRNNVRSSTFSTTFTVTGSRGSTLSNVNVMPSLRVSPDPVTPGTNLTVTGYSIPNATITVENQQEKSSVSLKTFTATSDGQGAWSVVVPTNGFQAGTYKIRAKAFQASSNISTNWSTFTFYGVGQAAARPGNTDLNRDGKVNLVDFSILLFWWNSDGGNSNPPADINQDGRVNLTDFSILIFNWTG